MDAKIRSAYKTFAHQLRSKETAGHGLAHAMELAGRGMGELPPGVHWRVYLELADFAKRERCFGQARRLYRKATELQPCAAQTWLECAPSCCRDVRMQRAPPCPSP